MNRDVAYSLIVGALLALLASGQVSAHGHAAAVDPQQADAWKYQLCGEMTTLAVQALYDRDKGRPMKTYPEDGGPGPRIANALIQKVYTEPSIASPKRAESFGRAFCNEALQKLFSNP